MSAAGTPAVLALHLEGPFAVVSKSADDNRIFAFTIYDAMHRLKINGQEISYNANDSYHFELQSNGLVSYAETQAVDPAFYWTTRSTPNWQYNGNSYFISMNLPCPQQIEQDCTSLAVFQDGTLGVMPRKHIFVYEISNFADVQLNCDELGSFTPDANGVLRIELGLDTTNTDVQHPIDFYNKLLGFLGLDTDPSVVLMSIRDRVPLAAAHRDKQMGKAGVKYSNRTLTLECKAGGIIGQT